MSASIKSTAQHDGVIQEDEEPLSDFYINLDGLLLAPMPDPVVGEETVNTTSHAPSISGYFCGNLAHWDTFEAEAFKFYSSAKVTTELERCKNLPIDMDPKKIEKRNPCAMTTELIQMGSEITLSGRYYTRALDPVIHAVQALTHPEFAGGCSDTSDFLPSKITFGDSWIIDQAIRPGGLEPDVVSLSKLRFNGKDEVRMVGDLKFFVTVNLKKMVKDALLISRPQKPCEILGQIVEYMFAYRTRYAFVSNYEETIFLLFEHSVAEDGSLKPCIYFSNSIAHDSTTGNKGSISVRLGHFFLVYKTNSSIENDWRISKSDIDKLKVEYRVKGSEERIHFYEERFSKYREKYSSAIDSSEVRDAQEDLQHFEQLWYMATHLVDTPHHYTSDEIKTLRCFRQTECAYTPHLLDSVDDRLPPGKDEQGMDGGFAVFILMTKVPGERISYDMFWNKIYEEREEIRLAFKKALLEVWRCSIYPWDEAMRNLMWDEEQRKCYLVDFEDHMDVKINDHKAHWKENPPYRAWNIAERRGPHQL